jgi:putative membrane protein
MMYWDGGTAWWGWLLMSLGMLVFWGGVIWLVWYAITHATQRTESPRFDSAPQRILDERFARGEIDVDEYRTRREALHTVEGHDPASAGGRP